MTLLQTPMPNLGSSYFGMIGIGPPPKINTNARSSWTRTVWTLTFFTHILLSNTGRHSEALAEVKRARELDPLNLRTNALEGQFLIHAGRSDEALARLQKTFEMAPNYYFAHFFASSAYIEKGMFPEAIAEARKARELSGPTNSHPMGFLGYALAKSGKQRRRVPCSQNC
jgi:tetratricopeptide (TPR) repeat protein